MLASWVEPLLLPPLSCLVLGMVGLVVKRWRPRLGKSLIAAAVLMLWVAATPLVGGALLRSLQAAGPVDTTGEVPGALVVLSADMDRTAPEFGGPTVGGLTLQRIRYAAHLHRATGAPVLVSGGIPARGFPPLADVMRDSLRDDFAVTVRWRETRSGNTWENARFSADLLEAEGIDRIYLVTHAWHMPRAQAAFEACGLQVVAAPTAFRSPATDVWRALVPRWTALRDTGLALHEWIGRAWYALAYH